MMAWGMAGAPAGAACLATPSDDAAAARVVGGDPLVFFVRDGDEVPGCPNPSAGCRAKAYLTNGDIVVATVTSGAYRCATFTSKRGVSTSNWLPAASLAPLAGKPVRLDDWLGHWVVGEAQMTITRAGAGGALSVDGAATWGAFDPDRVRRGGVNTGEFQAVVTPAAGRLAFTVAGDKILPYDQGDALDCRLQLSLVGPYLLVADNNSCGGHNVTFSGAYRRKG